MFTISALFTDKNKLSALIDEQMNSRGCDFNAKKKSGLKAVKQFTHSLQCDPFMFRVGRATSSVRQTQINNKYLCKAIAFAQMTQIQMKNNTIALSAHKIVGQMMGINDQRPNNKHLSKQ